MRIRRRPPGQPLAYLLLSDPPAPQPPSGASGHHHQEHPAGDKKEEAAAGLHFHLHPNAAADLGDGRSSAARRPALLALLPQDSVVERGRGLGTQQQGPEDCHRSLENGHHHVPVPVINAGERLSSNGGVGSALALTTTAGANATRQPEMKDEGGGGGGGGNKKPRGPGVLMEGSRCSRKNGRGWRCSQPTLVGYALCQYHLGKGRMRSSAGGGAGAGVGAGRAAGAGQLGRTENGKRASAAAATATAAPPPKAGVPPPSVQVAARAWLCCLLAEVRSMGP